MKRDVSRYLISAGCLGVGLPVVVWLAHSPPAPAEPARAGPGPAPLLRVLLMQGVRQFDVTVDGPFDVRDGFGRTLVAGHRALALTTASAGPADAGGPALRLGGLTAAGAIIELVPDEPGTLGVVLPIERDKRRPRRFRGLLRCLLHGDGTVDVVNVVDVENYLKGVLRGELPPSFHVETFKAMAVAARTYALYERMTVGRKREWDVTATQSSQVYVGVDGERDCPKALAAVNETRGVVCTWDSSAGRKIFCTFYCAVCGGLTRDVSHMSTLDRVRPLAGGIECRHCWKAPPEFFRWGPQTIAKSTITERLRERYERFRQMGPIHRVEVAETDGFGRPVTIRLADREGRAETLRAESFRLALDPTGLTLKSADFRIVDAPGKVVFTHGKGWGHGAGLCQWGAEGLARSGRPADRILATYYPASHLTKAYE